MNILYMFFLLQFYFTIQTHFHYVWVYRYNKGYFNIKNIVVLGGFLPIFRKSTYSDFCDFMLPNTIIDLYSTYILYNFQFLL